MPDRNERYEYHDDIVSSKTPWHKTTFAMICFGVFASLFGLFVTMNFIVDWNRIGPGHVGIIINLAGSQRGASDIPVKTGWVFYSPLKESVVIFPTYVQTVKYSSDKNEGTAYNQEANFNSTEGMQFTSDVAISFSIRGDMAPHFYVKYKDSNLEDFEQGPLFSFIRQSMNEIGSEYKAEDIYGRKKQEFLARVQERIQYKLDHSGSSFDPSGLVIQSFGFLSGLRLPYQLMNAINAKTQATTAAEQAQNELAVVQAQVAKQVAQADGDAKSTIARATGNAEANRITTASLTPQLLEWKKIENQRAQIDRWNGELPHVQAGNGTGLLLQPQ